jgi:hypothetical protein
MNMLYEGMKDKGSLIIVPSSALETMNLGAVTQYAALKGQADAAAATGRHPAPSSPPVVPSTPPAAPPSFPGTTL